MRTIVFSLMVALALPAVSLEIPPGTQLYLTTNDSLIAKGDNVTLGMLVRSRVSRDITLKGQTLVKAGTPAIVKVSQVKRRNVAGIKGKLALSAVETQAVDGQKVYLSGGYNKEGKSRVGWAVGTGLLVAWPLLFIPGSAAELPAGTMFTAYTDGTVDVVVASNDTRRKINLSDMVTGFSVEVLYDELEKVEKPKFFDFLASVPKSAPEKFVIDSINGVEIKAMKMKTVSVDQRDDEKDVRTRIKIKPLAKQFKKGINRFDVSYLDEEGVRQASEIILDIEF